jgi:predicted DNA-binding protein YlxM (UPF0122 family)
MENKKFTPITRINKEFQLYGLYCPYNGELRYIGITTGLLSTRLSGHLRNPTNGKIALWFKELKSNNKKPIIKLIRKYETYENLLNAEIKEIKENKEKTNKLLNVADGGDINPMFGKTHTKEAKLKISLNNKGLKRTKEQNKQRKELLTKLWSNEEWSENLKKKMSENMIGNNRAVGYKHSDKTKKMLSDLHKNNTYSLGLVHSDVTRMKMSQNNSGENNPMFGKSLSKEVLLKRSEKVKKEGTFKGKNNGNFKYDINEDELKELYLYKNLKISEIADLYGCHRTVISDNIKKYNIKKETSNKYNLDIVEINNYKLKGLSLVQIGKIYGCSNKLIHKYIKKHGK